MKEREAVQDPQKTAVKEPSAPKTQGKVPETVPLHAFAQLLDGGTDWTALPEPLLRALAQGVGNSGVAELLRGSVGGDPGLLPIPEAPEEAEGLGPNEIVTAPPRLTAPAVWEGPGWPQPSGPRSLRDRGAI